MHEGAAQFFTSQLRDLPPRTVVEFGSCNVNGSVRSMYPQALSWHGIDVCAGDGVDEVADAATWTTPERFGVVVCAEVFEHTAHWRKIIRTAWDVLEPGGLLVASCATGNRPEHSTTGGPLPEGEHYRNVPRGEMVRALAGWTSPSVTVADGVFGGDDLYVTATRGPDDGAR